MKTRSLAIHAEVSSQRRLVASLMALSVAAVLAVWLAGEVRAGVVVPQAKPAEPPRAAAPVPGDRGAADAALERLIALHRSATLMSAAPPLPAGQCCAVAPAN